MFLQVTQYRRTARKYTLATFCIAAIAISTPCRAATVSNLSETPTSLTFDFSGSGLVDFVTFTPALQSLTYWNFISESRAGPLATYGFSLGLQHKPDGLVHTLGDFNSQTPYGTAL